MASVEQKIINQSNDITPDDLEFMGIEGIVPELEFLAVFRGVLRELHMVDDETVRFSIFERMLEIKDKFALYYDNQRGHEVVSEKRNAVIDVISALMNIPRKFIKNESMGMFSFELDTATEYGFKQVEDCFRYFRMGKKVLVHETKGRRLKKRALELVPARRINKNLKVIKKSLDVYNLTYEQDLHDLYLNTTMDKIPQEIYMLKDAHRVTILKINDGKVLIRPNTIYLEVVKKAYLLFLEINDKIKRYRVMAKKPMMKKKFILLWPTLTWFREAINEESKKGEIDSIPVITSILKRIKKICEEATDFQDPKNLVRHSKGIQFFELFKNRIGEVLEELEEVKKLF